MFQLLVEGGDVTICPIFNPATYCMENEAAKLLSELRVFYTQDEIATYLKRNPRTVKRWEAKSSPPPEYAVHGLRSMLAGRMENTSQAAKFRFIDLFAGIGGMRLGFESVGGKCVFTSEWDSYAQKTYRANFATSHEVAGDITVYPAENVPDHDVLLAGFPCQPFSIAGVSKKNSLGRDHGFSCDTQGTLFFDIARIIEEKKPAAFLLENVKNLHSHDKGNTFKVIMDTLQTKLGYNCSYRVIDAKGFVPQHRERIFIVGFRDPSEFSFDALKLPAPDALCMNDILHPQDGSEQVEPPYTGGTKAKVDKKYILSDKLWEYLQSYAEKHKKAGNGFGFGLVRKNSVSRTLSARYYKDGSEILVARGRGNPRRLTPRECARLMGYEHPDGKFEIPVSDTRAYKQFGNGVCVPVIKEIARIMAPFVIANVDEAGVEEPVAKQLAMFV